MTTLFVIVDKHNNLINSKTTSPTLQESSINGASYSLGKERPLNNSISIQNKIRPQESIKLNTFTELPKDVEGCVCYFYLSKVDETRRKYIMTEIFAQIAYISINGKMQKFNLVNFKDNLFYNYSNGDYTLRVEFKNKIKTDSENFSIKGVMMLFKAQKMLIKKNIIGECGC
ncbi:MAG: hypothetical protein JWR09_3210 [Mucilaginibacter sp.]|nr:hypothetical protein [Mucilaginibacter sp.]